MRSKLVIGGLCAAVTLLVGVTPARAQSDLDLDSGKLKAEQCRTYNITTSSSIILDTVAQAFQTVDLDIMLTTADGPDSGTERDLAAESVSTTSGYERLAIGLAGSTGYEITVCNLDQRTSRFTVAFKTVASPGVVAGPARIAFRGAFTANESVSDPELAEIQRIVRERTAKKR